MLELITAQQHLSSHVCYAAITSIAFGSLVLAQTRRRDETSQHTHLIFMRHVWRKIVIMCAK